MFFALARSTSGQAAGGRHRRHGLMCRCGRVRGIQGGLWAEVVTVQVGPWQAAYAGTVHLGLAAIVISEYDPAISFFVDALGFELVEDSPSLTNDGHPKRWVVVRPPGAATGLLLARADGEDQASVVGKQVAGRVGFFLHVEDFDAAYTRMSSAGGGFLCGPGPETNGRAPRLV